MTSSTEPRPPPSPVRVRRSYRPRLYEAFCTLCPWVGPPRTDGRLCAADGSRHIADAHDEGAQ